MGSDRGRRLSRNGSWACRSSPRSRPSAFSFDVLDATKLIPEELVPVRAGRPHGARTATPTTSSPRPSRSRSARRTSCPASTSATTRCCRAASIRTSTRRSRASAARTSTRSRSTRRSRRCTTTSATACIARRSRAAASPTSRTRSAAAARSRPAPRGLRVVPASRCRSDKVRGKPEKFADHYTQATLFFDSQTAGRAGPHRRRLPLRAEQADGARDPRAHAVERCVNVSPDLARRVAEGLGMEVPAAMPRRWASRRRPRSTSSPALSLMALPGDGSIRTRKVAILVADGADAASIETLQDALRRAGRRADADRSAPRRRTTADGGTLEATGSMENSPTSCSTRWCCRTDRPRSTH